MRERDLEVSRDRVGGAAVGVAAGGLAGRPGQLPVVGPLSGGRAPGALVLNRSATSVTAAVCDMLAREFPGFLVVPFAPARDLRRALTEGSVLAQDAIVVVAGGDGTVGVVASVLAGTSHPLGVLGLGTFNNFARALGIPEDLREAAAVIRHGRPRPVTLGRVDRVPFLEAASIGIFGEAIAVGQYVKELHLREAAAHLAPLLRARPFRFRLRGDLDMEGTASSLIFANTPSIGAAMAIAEGPLTDAFLELSIHPGESRRDILGRFLAAAVLRRHRQTGTLRFRRVVIEASPVGAARTTNRFMTVYCDGVPLARTPVTIEADLGSLQVILPYVTGEDLGARNARTGGPRSVGRPASFGPVSPRFGARRRLASSWR